MAQHASQRTLARDLVHQLNLRCRQIDVRGNDVEVRRGRVTDGRDDVGLRVHEQGVDRLLHVQRVDPQPHGGRSLGVEIDDEDPAPVLGQRGTQVDGRRGLPHPALLVTHRDNAGRTVSRQRRRHRKIDRFGGQVGRERRMRIHGHRLILVHCFTFSSVPRALGCETVNTSRNTVAVTRV